MKWGIRRYQNKDGTLTAEGRAHMKDTYSKLDKERRQTYTKLDKDRKGVREAGEGVDVIKKGATFQRLANEEGLDSRRKYVSILGEDNRKYDQDAYVLGMDLSKDIYKYELTATKDLKVANGAAVTKHILDTYGDTKIKDIFSEYDELGGRNVDDWSLNKSEDTKWMRDYRSELEIKMSHYMKGVLYDSGGKETKSADILNHFKSKGYDAIVDVEDYIGGVADYPLILLNPETSVTVTGKKNFYED